MNILVDILHPAHVHFFLRYLRSAKEQGHEVTITTRNKEITNALLDRLGLPYQHISTPAPSKVGQMLELVLRWIRLAWLIRRKKIDIAMSISGLCTGLPARVQGVANIAFSDTEDATLSNRLSLPFCNYFVTPEFFLHELGSKHVRYRGLHETAYLKNFDFESAKATLAALNFSKPYSIVRLVANDALHDIGIRGIPAESLDTLIEELGRFGQVFIASQAGLPERLARYRLSIPIEHIHAVLAGAALYVGDSPTMAVESSILGTPALLLTSRHNRLGNMINMEKRFNLLLNFSEFSQLIAAVREIEDPISFKSEWSDRAAQFRDYVEDVDAVIERIMDKALSEK